MEGLRHDLRTPSSLTPQMHHHKCTCYVNSISHFRSRGVTQRNKEQGDERTWDNKEELKKNL